MLVSSIVLEKEGAFRQNHVPTMRNEEKLPTNKLLSEKLLSLFNKINDYKRIKEKIIGKALTFAPDHPIVIKLRF